MGGLPRDLGNRHQPPTESSTSAKFSPHAHLPSDLRPLSVWGSVPGEHIPPSAPPEGSGGRSDRVSVSVSALSASPRGPELHVPGVSSVSCPCLTGQAHPRHCPSLLGQATWGAPSTNQRAPRSGKEGAALTPLSSHVAPSSTPSSLGPSRASGQWASLRPHQAAAKLPDADAN